MLHCPWCLWGCFWVWEIGASGLPWSMVFPEALPSTHSHTTTSSVFLLPPPSVLPLRSPWWPPAASGSNPNFWGWLSTHHSQCTNHAAPAPDAALVNAQVKGIRPSIWTQSLSSCVAQESCLASFSPNLWILEWIGLWDLLACVCQAPANLQSSSVGRAQRQNLTPLCSSSGDTSRLLQGTWGPSFLPWCSRRSTRAPFFFSALGGQ